MVVFVGLFSGCMGMSLLVGFESSNRADKRREDRVVAVEAALTRAVYAAMLIINPTPPLCVCVFVISSHMYLQATFAISGVSLTITLMHQLLYCLPNWQHLIALPFAASGLSIRGVVLTHAVYGLITAGHQYVQLRLLASHGAMTVGLVNAVRASVVSVISSLLFCKAKPELCLSMWRAISALVVTLGAMQWVAAGKPLTRQTVAAAAAEKEKKKET